ncbi:MAG: NAD(P)/FAD-dependent oxidoreductase [Alphaproteobacteria bacterium]
MKKYDNIIIGAGASGLYLGMFLKKTIILEKAMSVGNKLLISGGGNCNFTNKNITHENYLSKNPDFVKYALGNFKGLFSFLKENKLEWEEKTHGRLFLKQKGKNLIDAFIKKQKAEIKTSYEVKSIEKKDSSYIINNEFECNNLIIATGGMSYAGTDFGLKVAKQFGHKLVNTYPALVRVDVDDEKITSLAGLSVQDVKSKQFKDGIVFTKRGIGGPLVYQLSLYLNSGDGIKLDFSECSHIPQRLRKLLNNKNELTITPKKTAGYKFAEAMAGGVDTSEIDEKTFESKKHKGLFFVGEVLDVTGNLGGYNLNFAFVSADCVRKML